MNLERIELWFTIAFAVDIVIRFLIWIPTPRQFFQSKKNNVDLFMALATLIIQIPFIRRSNAYVYLTVFQVLRIYRPIIYVERLRSLIVRNCQGSMDLAPTRTLLLTNGSLIAPFTVH